VRIFLPHTGNHGLDIQAKKNYKQQQAKTISQIAASLPLLKGLAAKCGYIITGH
jgi:hypothetical protein